MIYSLALDPGSKGAMVLINQYYNIVEVLDSPKDEIDFFNQLKDMVPKKYDHLFLSSEDVHSVFSAGKQQTFTFGANDKLCSLSSKILINHFIKNASYHKLQPKEWQKIAWSTCDKNNDTRKKNSNLHDPKKVSFNAAKRIFPNYTWLKTYDGRYDAALIAYATLRLHVKTEHYDQNLFD